MNTREIIEYAICIGKSVKIAYSKNGLFARYFRLSSISYSSKLGKDYICAICEGYETELTFKIDKICRVEVEWLDVYKINNAPNKGLYVLAIRGLGSIDYELHICERNSPFISRLETGEVVMDILAFHYVPLYNMNKHDYWKVYDKDKIESKRGIYIFAYTINQRPIENDEWVDIPSEYRLMNIDSNNIHYTAVTSINNLRIQENIELLAYHFCSDYTEDDHAKHWEYARIRGFIK